MYKTSRDLKPACLIVIHLQKCINRLILYTYITVPGYKRTPHKVNICISFVFVYKYIYINIGIPRCIQTDLDTFYKVYTQMRILQDFFFFFFFFLQMHSRTYASAEKKKYVYLQLTSGYQWVAIGCFISYTNT